MSKVFILEDKEHRVDYSSATEFGELTFVFGAGDRRPSFFKANKFIDEVLRRLDAAGYTNDEDHLCITGSMIGVSLMVAAVFGKFSQANLLLWSASNSKYESVIVDLFNPNTTLS